MSLILLVVGAGLLAASFGQYGYMAWRQRQLQSQLAALDAPARNSLHAAAMPARAAQPRGLRLIIPGIHLDDAVVRGTSYVDLLVAPGLLEGSPLPGAGGNTVIAGHRDTFFRRVADLHAGDAIELQSGGRLYTYRVSSRQIVQPTDTSVLDNTPTPVLTLVTCYPTYWIGPAPDRLIVRASLVASRPRGSGAGGPPLPRGR